jgi:hypothetical protein
MPRTYGYKIREPYAGEHEYFRKNLHVGGMAGEDNRIVLNPYSPLTPKELDAVAENEAIRLYLREKNIKPDFDLTPEQKKAFRGTPYEKDEGAARATILGRIISGDPSALGITPQQKNWADNILKQLNDPESMNQRQFEEWRMLGKP